ncbi:MAG: RNA-protein complex protein Nop10 [Candidatus Thorarchaeota archaeon]|nr:RNA-protein complex protein Nop10 [Candidatus Thorarchaeota archaeon]
MVQLLKKCIKCDAYTIKNETCPTCGGHTKTPHPPKFSMDDKYLRYKIIMKRLTKQEKNT